MTVVYFMFGPLKSGAVLGALKSDLPVSAFKKAFIAVSDLG